MIYLKRLLGLPFFICLMLIAYVWQLLVKSYWWVKYGGEAINYSDKMNRKTISDIFYKLQALENES